MHYILKYMYVLLFRWPPDDPVALLVGPEEGDHHAKVGGDLPRQHLPSEAGPVEQPLDGNSSGMETFGGTYKLNHYIREEVL